MGRVKSKQTLYVRGKWRGSRPMPKGVSDGPTPTVAAIMLPLNGEPRRTKGAPNVIASAKKFVDAPAQASLKSRKCMITRLPTEILLEIVSYSVPVGASIHVFPSTKLRYSGTETTFVHIFSEECSIIEDQAQDQAISRPREHLTAVARVCRALSEAYCSTIYGNNNFIFELSHSVYPCIEGPCPSRVESWTKSYRGRRQALWPLTSRTVQYVKDITILGTLQWRREDWVTAMLREQLLRAIRILKLGQHINSLTIDLRRWLEHLEHPYIITPSMPQTPGVHVLTQSYTDPVTPNSRLGWNVNGPDDNTLRLRDSTVIGTECDLVDLWMLFKDVRGIRDVSLSGNITSKLAKELHDKMTDRSLPARASRSAVKPQQSTLKRKSVSERQLASQSRKKT